MYCIGDTYGIHIKCGDIRQSSCVVETSLSLSFNIKPSNHLLLKYNSIKVSYLDF